jgi:hypothetical protein
VEILLVCNVSETFAEFRTAPAPVIKRKLEGVIHWQERHLEANILLFQPMFDCAVINTRQNML